MQWGSWVVARARASATLLLALLALVALTATILALTGGLATWIATSAARTVLENSPPGRAGVQLQARVGDDAGAQEALARRALADGFAPASVDVWTTLVSEPVRVDGVRVVAWAGDHLADHAEVVEGTWPAGADEAALHASAASLAGVEVGDGLGLGEHEVTVTALWRPADAEDPRWHGDVLALEGADGQIVGPLVVPRDTLLELVGTPYLRWVVVPDIADATRAQFEALSAGAEDAASLVEEADATGRGVTSAGSLAETVRSAERDWSVARTLSVVPLGILMVVAVVAVAQVARVLTSVRDRESRFLVARGANTRQLLSTSLLEALVVVVVGAAAGTVVAVMVLRVLSGSWAEAPQAFLGGAAGAVLAFLVIGTVGWIHLRRVTADPFQGQRRVGLAVGGAAGLLLVSAAAAVTSWQLVSGRGGEPGDDRLTLLPALAPAALLALAGLLGVVALVPLARLVEALGRRLSRQVTAWLAAAHLARNLGLVAVPVVLTTTAVGSLVVAGLFAGSSTALQRSVSDLERGADVRATLSAPVAATASVPQLPAASGVPGVIAAAPVWVDEKAVLGDVALDLVAAPVGTLPGVASLPSGVELPVAALEDPVPPTGIPLPPGARSLTIRLEGGLALDPWQQARLELLPELHRREAAAPWIVGDKDEAARELTEEALDDYRPTASVRTEVVLREPDTGMVHVVTGPELTIPGLDPVWDRVTDDVTAAPTTASVETSVALPAEVDVVVDGVVLHRLGRDTTPPRLTVEVQLEAAGTALGEPGWTADAALRSDHAAPYLERREATTVEASITQPEDLPVPLVETNRPTTPPVLTATDGGWRLEGDQTDVRAVRIGPGVGFLGDDPLGVAPDATMVSRVSVALTPAAAEAALLAPGDAFELIAFQRRIPATLAALTPAVPGSSEPRGALVDSAALGRVLSSLGLTLPWPTELWMSGPEVEPRDVAALAGVEAVAVPIDRPDTVTLSQLTFWMGAVGTLLLALAGAAATFVAQLTSRRPEVDVLRRLGVAGRSQGWSRLVEHALALGLSAVAGAAAGMLIGRVVVPPLALAATGSPRDTVVPLHLDVGPASIILLVWWLVVAAVLAAVARAVTAQARRPAEREVDQ